MPDALVARVRFGARASNSIQSFDLGSDVPIWIDVVDALTQAPSDDETIGVVIYQADGEVLSPALTLTRQSEGVYYTTLTPDQAGIWTAIPSSELDDIEVRAQRFSMQSATPAPAVVGPNAVASVNGIPGPNPVLGAQHIGYQPAGGSSRTVAAHLSDARRHAPAFDVAGDGEVDDTDAITALLTDGGRLFFPDGDYLIAEAGPDAGGVLSTITGHLDVQCAINARFHSDGLDNTLFGIDVDEDALADYPDGVDITWRGGVFDLTDVKNSTVVPLAANFPPANPGTSSGCDGLRIRAFSGTEGAYIRLGRTLLVEDVRFIAGDHWQTAGGDSLLFAGAGFTTIIIRNCTFQGARDLGIYFSDIAGQPDSVTVILEGCTFINCFFGLKFARGHSGWTVRGNRYVNCVIGVTCTSTAGQFCRGGIIEANTFDGCSVNVRLDGAENIVIGPNRTQTVGAYEIDGTTDVDNYGTYMVLLAGARDCIVKDEVGGTVNAGHGAVTVVQLTPLMLLGLAGVVAPSQAGAASNQVVLPTSIGDFAGRVVGADAAITAGTGSGQRIRITAYDSGTRIATLASAWSAAPVAGASTLQVYSPTTGTRMQRLVSTDYRAVIEEETGSDYNVAEDCINLGTVGQRRPTLIGPNSYDIPPGMVRSVTRPQPRRNAYYPLGGYPVAATSAVGAADTLYLYPAALPWHATIALLYTRTVTGGAGSSGKVGLWRANATGMPTGLPVIAGNTGAASSSNNSTQVWTPAAVVRLDPWLYWVGTVWTGTMPTLRHLAGADTTLAEMVGAATSLQAFNDPVVGFSIAQTFANDIAALDLTGASLTPVISTAGIPIVGYEVD
jgi:hypothetical protein